LFYLSIVVFLIMGQIFLSIFVNIFSEAGNKTISVLIAVPVVAIIILYEGIVSGRDLGETGVKRKNFWRNVGIRVLVLGAYIAFFSVTDLILTIKRQRGERKV